MSYDCSFQANLVLKNFGLKCDIVKLEKLLSQFEVVVFDEKSAEILESLQRKHKAHKRYADMMIAAGALMRVITLLSPPLCRTRFNRFITVFITRWQT